MSQFLERNPSLNSYWRSIILFGQNVASYKFALAKSLLEFVENEKTDISLEDLAMPYAFNICEHLKIVGRQATSSSSAFIEQCRAYNSGEISKEALIDSTVKNGFNYVLDAFHVVNKAEIPIKFYDVKQVGRKKSLVLTDEILKLKEQTQYGNFPFEIEARWRLVETAWSLNISPKLLEVKFDPKSQNFIFDLLENRRRIDITSCRDALNGYQKGKCFYCFSDISVEPNSPDLADVDHFLPHTLIQFVDDYNLNGVWNLVLACKDCNRGEEGKFARVPKIKYLERLHKRNDFLISSHHPLRETLIRQTGTTEEERRLFLNRQYNKAKDKLIHTWEPQIEHEPVF